MLRRSSSSPAYPRRVQSEVVTTAASAECPCSVRANGRFRGQSAVLLSCGWDYFQLKLGIVFLAAE